MSNQQQTPEFKAEYVVEACKVLVQVLKSAIVVMELKSSTPTLIDAPAAGPRDDDDDEPLDSYFEELE